MKIIKVTYTVQAEFADGKTFMHFSEYNNNEAQQTLLTLPSFLAFQQQRDEHLEVQPHIEELQFVNATYTLFNE